MADARLHRHTQALAERGLTVELMGLGDAANSPREAMNVVAVKRPGMMGRAVLALRVSGSTHALLLAAGLYLAAAVIAFLALLNSSRRSGSLLQTGE